MIQYRMSTETWEGILKSRRKLLAKMYPSFRIQYLYECLDHTEYVVWVNGRDYWNRLYEDGHFACSTEVNP
jgi:hypothetical protein